MTKKKSFGLTLFQDSALIEEFENFLFRTEDQYIVLVSEDNEVMTVPYTTRWSKHYRKMVMARFNQLIQHFEGKNLDCVFGTLTVNPRKMSIYQSMTEIKSAWHNLHNALKDRYKKRTGKTTFDYILCCEPMRSGYIHLHFIIFNAVPQDFVDDYRIINRYDKSTDSYKRVGVSKTIDDLWTSYGFGYINQFERKHFESHRITSIIGYLIKYLTKSHDNMLFSAYLWATNTRSYSTSRAIGMIMSENKIKSEKNWSYVGSVDGWLVRAEGLHMALSAMIGIPNKILRTWNWLNCPLDYEIPVEI